MDANPPNPPYAVPPPFSPSLIPQQRAFDPVKPSVMEIENAYDRSQRAASVLSGMSIEDMEAAETLNSLHKEFHSPQLQQVPPTHIRTTTSYDAEQPEPLLSLVTSQYPLAASLINGSLSAYKTTQSFIPGAEWTERHVGLPLARTTARISGVEGGLRWALQPKRDSRTPQSATRTPDVEKGYGDEIPNGTSRQGGEVAYGEMLPAYNPGDRSPPYSEQQVVLSRERQPPPGWRQQLVISTSGLGIAMSEESLRSLHYCLSWLRWANGRLDVAIQSLKDLLVQWESNSPSRGQAQPMSVARMTQSEAEGRQAAMSARIAALKAEVLQTLKQVVNVVSTYAGGALPENARNLVHRHLTSLPQRFSIASAKANNNENGDEAASNANRALVLAQEGLDMMTQVSRVVNDTLVSAEDWCEKLGRRKPHESEASHQQLINGGHKPEDRERSMTVGRDQDDDMDVKMQM